jgi:hypothetical protein
VQNKTSKDSKVLQRTLKDFERLQRTSKYLKVFERLHKVKYGTAGTHASGDHTIAQSDGHHSKWDRFANHTEIHPTQLQAIYALYKNKGWNQKIALIPSHFFRNVG